MKAERKRVVPQRLDEQTLKRIDVVRARYLPELKGCTGLVPVPSKSAMMRWLLLLGLDEAERLLALPPASEPLREHSVKSHLTATRRKA